MISIWRQILNWPYMLRYSDDEKFRIGQLYYNWKKEEWLLYLDGNFVLPELAPDIRIIKHGEKVDE